MPAPAAPAGVPRRPLLWIALAAVAVYGWAATFDFAWFDDNHLIQENAAYLSDPAHIAAAFTQGYFDAAVHGKGDYYYRPLVTVTYILDALIAPGSPFVGHVTNILLHAAAACLVFVLLGRVGARRDLAFALALLFAVHPLAGNAVGWVPGRNDLLLAVFAMTAFIASGDYLRTGSQRAALTAAAGFVAALLTKETAVAVAPAVAAYAWFGTTERVPRARALTLAAVGGATLAVWLLVRHAVLGATFDESPAAKLVYIAGVAPLAIVQAFGKCVLPVNLSVFPATADTSSIWGVAAIAACAWLVWRVPGRWRLATFGAIWFVLFLLPSLGSTFGTIPTALECRIYVPLIGALMIAVDIAARYDVSLRAPRARAAVAVVLVAAAATAVVALAPYRDKVAFWENAVKTSPHSPVAHDNRGIVYFAVGRAAEAEQDFRDAIALNPAQRRVHHSLGTIFFLRGRLDSAEAEYRKELAVNPTSDVTLGDLGVVMLKRGNSAEAVKYLRASVAANPAYAPGWEKLAKIYTELQDRQHAAECAARLTALGSPVPPEVAAFVGGR